MNDSHWSFRQDAFLTYAIREAWREQKTGFATTVGRRLNDEIDRRPHAPQRVGQGHGHRRRRARHRQGVPGREPARVAAARRPVLEARQLARSDRGREPRARPSSTRALGRSRVQPGAGQRRVVHPALRGLGRALARAAAEGQRRVGRSTADTPDIPIYERFFAGGASSIRGFAYRGVGPMQNGNPTGGKAMWLANVGVRFPVFGVPAPGAPSLRGVFFVGHRKPRGGLGRRRHRQGPRGGWVRRSGRGTVPRASAGRRGLRIPARQLRRRRGAAPVVQLRLEFLARCCRAEAPARGASASTTEESRMKSLSDPARRSVRVSAAAAGPDPDRGASTSSAA